MDQLINYLSSLPGAVAQGMIWGIMAIGVYITYKVLDIADLTVDGSICTGAAVCATMMTLGYSLPLAMLCAFIAGMLAGLLTGIFHTFMNIPAILSGILTQLILWSVNLKIMGLALGKTSAANLPLSSRNFNTLISMLNMNRSLIILAVICAVMIAVLYWFFGTEFGCSLRTTGANPNMSRAQGINTNVAKILGLVLSNGIVAFSGALLAQYQGNSDANMGKGAIVIGLAAVIIGEALFGWFARNNFALKLITVILGGIIYFIVYSTVIYLGLDSNYLKMLSAIVVAIFLAAPYWRKKYFSRAKNTDGEQQKLKKKAPKGKGKENA
ncbi:MAG: ABC transporter permease [Clostridia bacterium]|nr:ABC transporter permease [Clostridia bacterium]